MSLIRGEMNSFVNGELLDLSNGTAVPLLSYVWMFQVVICSQQLEICKSVCMFIILAIIVETD